ncbi:MAG: Fe-S cluster assembly protein NifU [Planctomycetes bacterium]|jgi:NifU-like protein|nr:Fe-S cluster assembly protein NifU [Phycisphaerae bacterium]NBB96194.1 Fe-S cluster assembly protein NifU [Planctomycetota bacterium]
MWDYTDDVKKHFLEPRHAGQIDHPDMDATVGNITCGDALRLMAKLDEQHRIVDAKFQTFGCASAIASSDVLIDLILGKTVDEAAVVTNQDIANALGGLPDAKMHCSVMGVEALRKAIAEWRGEPFDLDDHGHVVCQCFGVTDTLIEKVLREEKLRTVDEVTHYTKAGGGCGACHGKIRQIISAVWGAPAETPAKPAAAGAMTNLQRMQKVQEVIETEIRPVLQNDGGDLELIDIDGTTVKVAFRGSCAWCRARDFTLDGTIGAKLRELVDPDITVEDVSETLA